VSFRRYLILIAVAVFAASGDVCLARGMRDFGAVSLANMGGLLTALLNPWIVAGILLLICFFSSYLTALSWADLTYVLPATAISYVMMALLAQQVLHEHVSTRRWLGIALITLGVGFVAAGPSRTTRPPSNRQRDREELPVAVGGGEQ
jgi:drug/metabolite transporter (DMT)-like permease